MVRDRDTILISCSHLCLTAQQAMERHQVQQRLWVNSQDPLHTLETPKLMFCAQQALERHQAQQRLWANSLGSAGDNSKGASPYGAAADQAALQQQLAAAAAAGRFFGAASSSPFLVRKAVSRMCAACVVANSRCPAT